MKVKVPVAPTPNVRLVAFQLGTHPVTRPVVAVTVITACPVFVIAKLATAASLGPTVTVAEDVLFAIGVPFRLTEYDTGAE